MGSPWEIVANVATGGGYGLVKGAVEGDASGAAGSLITGGWAGNSSVASAIGAAVGGAATAASESGDDGSFTMDDYMNSIAAAQDHYTDTMRELTEQSIRENKKFAVLQLASTKINQAAMDDYRVAQNFVLRNIESGYIEQETRMGVPSAAIPMPFIDGHAVAANAPQVDTPAMFDGDPDPLTAREDHMNRMDQIVAQVESGEELSDVDKDYLSGLQPPVDWRNVDAIYHEADEAHQAYDAFANARTPEADPEAFRAWLDEVGQSNGELSQQVMDAYQTKETLKDIKDYAMGHPFATVAESVDGFTIPDPDDPKHTISGSDYLTRLGYDPSTMTLSDLNAAVEQAETDFSDAQTALSDYVDNSHYTGPAASAGSQSVPAIGTSSLDLHGADSEDDLDTAASLVAQLS